MIDPTGGRAELERLLSGATKRIVAQSRRVAATTAERINAGDSAADAVAFAMTKHKVAIKAQEEVGRAVVQSLCVGNGIWPKVTADMMPTLQKTALAGIWDDSDLSLSQRLHGTDAAMRADVVVAINAHVQARNDTWTASRRIYDGYGFGGALNTAKLNQLPADLRRLEQSARKVLTPDAVAQLQQDAKRLSAYADRLATAPLKAAYKQMAAKLEKGLTAGLERLVQTATEEKARYHASRILRTESARAWGQGFQAQCDTDPDVVGWRWETSGAHKIFDICDFHARADLYNMGPGIYPKDRHPSYPAHPHCLCQASMVFKGEVPDPRPNVQGGGKAALDGMTGSQRARLLTVGGSKGFNGNGQWQDNLRHWTGAGPTKLSAGARAVMMGVQQWQPDFQLVPKAEPAKVERFTAEGLLKPGQALSKSELDFAWSKIDGDPLLVNWRASGKSVPAGLDKREAAFVYHYTKNGYIGLNHALRSGGAVDPVYVAQQGILNSALTKMGLKKYGETFRGISLSESQLAKFVAEHPKNREFVWDAFTSSSLADNVAGSFGHVQFVIMNPIGCDLTNISGIPRESEVLIPSGARFIVRNVVQDSAGLYTFYLESL